jgi:hypothetical protein
MAGKQYLVPSPYLFLLSVFLFVASKHPLHLISNIG